MEVENVFSYTNTDFAFTISWVFMCCFDVISKSLKVSDRAQIISGSSCMKRSLLGVLSDKMQITFKTERNCTKSI